MPQQFAPHIALLITLAATLPIGAAEAATWPGFELSPWFGEQVCFRTLDPGVRVIINAPRADRVDARRSTRIVLFATPNGNTAEHTLGSKSAGPLDWRYDIQHIAAQTRTLRELCESENIVLACIQAGTLSWPAWRQRHPDHATISRSLVDAIVKLIPLSDPKVTLACHSGGGSFLFAFINGGESIPDGIDRIIFLDANYGYSDADAHGDKLLSWLRSDESHRLICIAYDDRNIKLNGKRVVGPTGGTFRATHRMIDRFTRDVSLEKGTLATPAGDFASYQALGGRLVLLIHPNPDNIILHTRLVGEMNGHLYAIALGTPVQERWGVFGGPRAYEQWVQPEPYTFGPTTSTDGIATAIPTRPMTAVGGREFMRSVESFTPADREAAILSQVLSGNVPEFLREFTEIRAQAIDRYGVRHTLTFHVSPDYLAIGSNSDFVRVPVRPMTAQAIADRFGCVLPTRKLVNDIHAQAQVILTPEPMTVNREAAATFVLHNDIIERQRLDKPLGLISGIKKDIVLTNRLLEAPGKVAIYGWHRPDGQPIQPLTTVHTSSYVDYSHGARLVRRNMIVDGKKMSFEEISADPVLSNLISDEGPLRITRYPIE